MYCLVMWVYLCLENRFHFLRHCVCELSCKAIIIKWLAENTTALNLTTDNAIIFIVTNNTIKIFNLYQILNNRSLILFFKKLNVRIVFWESSKLLIYSTRTLTHKTLLKISIIWNLWKSLSTLERNSVIKDNTEKIYLFSSSGQAFVSARYHAWIPSHGTYSLYSVTIRENPMFSLLKGLTWNLLRLSYLRDAFCFCLMWGRASFEIRKE